MSFCLGATYKRALKRLYEVGLERVSLSPRSDRVTLMYKPVFAGEKPPPGPLGQSFSLFLNKGSILMYNTGFRGNPPPSPSLDRSPERQSGMGDVERRQLTVVQQFKIDWGEPFASILVAMEAQFETHRPRGRLGLGRRRNKWLVKQKCCPKWSPVNGANDQNLRSPRFDFDPYPNRSASLLTS